MNVVQTSHKLTLRGPQRHVDRSMASQSVSSSTTEPISGTTPATLMQRRPSDRSCQSRDTTCGHVSSHEVRMVADGAWSEKGSAEAWHGASGRTHTCIGAHQDGCVHQTRVFMKPALICAALSRPRGASSVMLHPCPVQSRRSKSGLSEYSLVAGNEPAKAQVMPMTCSRVAAADGSDIAKRRGSK